MSVQNFSTYLSSAATGGRPTRRHPTASPWCLEPLEHRRLLSFSMPVEYGAGVPANALVSADFNGDGRLDLATGNYDDGTVSVLLGNGDGTFQPARTSVAGTGPPQLVAGDLNADGKADLVTVSNWSYPSFLNVLLSNGDGTFQPPQAVTLPDQFVPDYTDPGAALGQGATSAVVGDLDGDGNLDLIAGARISWLTYTYYQPLDPPEIEFHGHDYVNVLLGNGDGTFRVGSVKPDAPPPLASGDANNDGRLDVVIEGGTLLGNGDGTLQDVLRSDVYVGNVVGNVANPLGDFNGDGKLDVLSHSHQYGPVVLSLGNGDGTFRRGEPIDPDVFTQSTAVGDVNADGKLDIVKARSVFSDSGDPDYYDTVTTRSARVLLGNGDGSFAPPITVDLGTLPGVSVFTSPVLADFDGNGFPDLAASVGSYSGVYVMLNDGGWTVPPPPPPSITMSDVTATEANTGTRAAAFTVTLSAASAQPVTVAYATADGTATAGSDYQPVSGTLTIPAGQTTGAITVPVNGDRSAEANESFFVNLTTPTNATITDGQGVGTILDDEPRISISDAAVKESRRGHTTLFTFRVTLSAPYDQAVTMSFRTSDGTAKTSDGDYLATAGTLTFNPGETTRTITVQVKGDTKREPDEYFYLDLFGASSGSLFSKNRGIGTILNDD